MEPRRTARSTAFLTGADRRLLLPFVARWAHRVPRGRGIDHQGRPSECAACASLVDGLLQEVGARSAREGWTSVGDVIRDLRRRSSLRASMLQDARRRYLGELGLRSRPDRDAKTWFRPVLEEASARGALGAPASVAEKLVEWAIDFAQDLDQQGETGSLLPFERLARSLSTHFGTSYTADEIRLVWEEVEAACAGDAAAWDRLDRLVLRHGGHVDEIGLEVESAAGDSDSRPRSVEERGRVSPLWGAPAFDDGRADPSSGTAEAPGVVAVAADEVRAWASSLGRKPSAARRRDEAADRLRAELLRRHPTIAPDQASRYLDQEHPVFAELLEEVLAHADQ